MCSDVSHPEPGHVGPDRMGTGAVGQGALAWGSQGGDCGFEGILA